DKRDAKSFGAPPPHPVFPLAPAPRPRRWRWPQRVAAACRSGAQPGHATSVGILFKPLKCHGVSGCIPMGDGLHLLHCKGDDAPSVVAFSGPFAFFRCSPGLVDTRFPLPHGLSAGPMKTEAASSVSLQSSSRSSIVHI